MTEKTDIMELQDEALKCSSLIRAAISTLFDADANQNSITSTTLRRLIRFMSSRMQAAHFILSHGYSWDAEIILRSCMETSLKFMRICLAEGAAADDLAYEFSVTLLKVYHKKQVKPAKHAEGIYKDTDSMDAKILKFLYNETFFEQSDLSRKEIQKLQQKWSFSGLIKALKDTPKEKMGLNMIEALLHSYSMASHLAHGDIIALDLMEDRTLRESGELYLLEKSHNARIIVDSLCMLLLCCKASSVYLQTPLSNEAEIETSVCKCLKISEKINEAFYASQEDFYTT